MSEQSDQSAVGAVSQPHERTEPGAPQEPSEQRDPTNPQPPMGTTLADALAVAAKEGFDGSFTVTEEGTVRCNQCRSEVAAADVDLTDLRRVEGASDPADMAAVLTLRCPQCGQAGTAVVRYGVEASAGEAEVLQHLQDRR